MNTLNAKEGMYLTQVGDTDNRVYSKSITGVRATYEFWKDASEDEKLEWDKQQEELQKQLDLDKEAKSIG